MAVELLRQLFTVDQYYQIFDAGILTENKRVELIRG
ncbi:MAG: Uma2 family endonuclease, partial [Okeania sp. SIO3C4]|nr:Uma2 family endonuclease [Okeania sp. SIO3C4]